MKLRIELEGDAEELAPLLQTLALQATAMATRVRLLHDVSDDDGSSVRPSCEAQEEEPAIIQEPPADPLPAELTAPFAPASGKSDDAGGPVPTLGVVSPSSSGPRKGQGFCRKCGYSGSSAEHWERCRPGETRPKPGPASKIAFSEKTPARPTVTVVEPPVAAPPPPRPPQPPGAAWEACTCPESLKTLRKSWEEKPGVWHIADLKTGTICARHTHRFPLPALTETREAVVTVTCECGETKRQRIRPDNLNDPEWAGPTALAEQHRRRQRA